MSVVTSIESKGSCERQLHIEVPQPAVEAERQRVEQGYRSQARLPGFRKGKAPLELVRRRFRGEIEEELIERLVPRYWQQAKAEKELVSLLPPRVADVELKEDSLRFTALVEVSPEVRIGQLEGFELPDPPGEPAPQDVDQAIEDLRREAGTWRPVERSAGQGDRVSARIDEDEEPADETDDATDAQQAPERDPIQFEVGDPQVWEELSVAVSGLGAGQKGRFERREPRAEGAGPGEGEEAHTRRFRLEVLAVEERELPELDDAFARRVHENFDSLESLREEVTRRLRAGRQRERRRQREQAALDQLRDRYPLELPERVVQHEVEQMAREWAGEMARQGIDVERAPVDWQALFADLQPRAERRVHARLLLDAAVDQHGIEVPPDELERALQEIGRLENKPASQVRQRLAASGALEELEAQLKRRRLIDRLLGEESGDESAEETKET